MRTLICFFVPTTLSLFPFRDFVQPAHLRLSFSEILSKLFFAYRDSDFCHFAFASASRRFCLHLKLPFSLARLETVKHKQTVMRTLIYCCVKTTLMSLPFRDFVQHVHLRLSFFQIFTKQFFCLLNFRRLHITDRRL